MHGPAVGMSFHSELSAQYEGRALALRLPRSTSNQLCRSFQLSVCKTNAPKVAACADRNNWTLVQEPQMRWEVGRRS